MVQVYFPADKVNSALKRQEGENTAVAFKTTLSSHSFTISGEKWWAEKKSYNIFTITHTCSQNEEWHWEEHLDCTKIFHSTKISCINNNTVMLCCAVCILMATNSTIISVRCRMQAGVGGRRHSVWISSLSLLWQPVQWRLTCWSGLIM